MSLLTKENEIVYTETEPLIFNGITDPNHVCTVVYMHLIFVNNSVSNTVNFLA